MESVTFEFKSERNWDRVYDILYTTSYHFTCYGYKAITVWGEEAVEYVRSYCKRHRIAIKEI